MKNNILKLITGVICFPVWLIIVYIFLRLLFIGMSGAENKSGTEWALLNTSYVLFIMLIPYLKTVFLKDIKLLSRVKSLFFTLALSIFLYIGYGYFIAEYVRFLILGKDININNFLIRIQERAVYLDIVNYVIFGVFIIHIFLAWFIFDKILNIKSPLVLKVKNLFR